MRSSANKAPGDWASVSTQTVTAWGGPAAVTPEPASLAATRSRSSPARWAVMPGPPRSRTPFAAAWGWRPSPISRQAGAWPSSGVPLLTQQAVQQVIGPLALGPGALAQVALAAHAQPFQHGGGCRIPRIAVGGDPVLAPRGEQVTHQQARRL